MEAQPDRRKTLWTNERIDAYKGPLRRNGVDRRKTAAPTRIDDTGWQLYQRLSDRRWGRDRRIPDRVRPCKVEEERPLRARCVALYDELVAEAPKGISIRECMEAAMQEGMDKARPQDDTLTISPGMIADNTITAPFRNLGRYAAFPAIGPGKTWTDEEVMQYALQYAQACVRLTLEVRS